MSELRHPNEINPEYKVGSIPYYLCGIAVGRAEASFHEDQLNELVDRGILEDWHSVLFENMDLTEFQGVERSAGNVTAFYERKPNLGGKAVNMKDTRKGVRVKKY